MRGCDNTVRIVEAYIGEYASGKSENAINRALELLSEKRRVTLVDLDTVEPFYTLRPIKKKLEEMGLAVIAWSPEETMGLGEAGSLINQEMIWALHTEGDIIFDVGYGVHGSKIFNLIEGANTDPDLKIYAVVNIARPMTSTKEDIVAYIRELGQVDGIINNTHLGNETTSAVVQEGARMITEAAAELRLPLLYSAATKDIADQIGAQDQLGNPVKIITRYMPEAFW